MISVEIKIFNRLVNVFIVERNISFKYINHLFPGICLYEFFYSRTSLLKFVPTF